MNADQLIVRVKARAFVPETSSFTINLILDEINTAVRTMWAEALVKADGEFFTETADLLPDVSGHAVLPADALSSTARVLTWVDANGQESSPLRRVEQGDIGSVSGKKGSGTIMVQQSDGTFVTVTGTSSSGYGAAPTSFALTPNGAQLFSYTPSGKLRCRYSRRPGQLVAGTSFTVMQVASVNAGISFTTTTPDGVVPTLATWQNQALDLTSGKSPYRRRVLTPLLVSAGVNLWTYTGSQVAVGDFLTFPGTTYVPNAPLEWHDLLMYYASATLASLRKDYDLEARRMGEAGAIFTKLLNTAQPRTKQNPKALSAWAGRNVNSNG